MSLHHHCEAPACEKVVAAAPDGKLPWGWYEVRGVSGVQVCGIECLESLVTKWADLHRRAAAKALASS